MKKTGIEGRANTTAAQASATKDDFTSTEMELLLSYYRYRHKQVYPYVRCYLS